MSFQFNKINPRQLFLVDSLGALLSAIMLGIVLTRFETVFGMPSEVLYPLSLMASVLCIYSFMCYINDVKNKGFYLKIIAIANGVYCCISLVLMFFLYQNLTNLGLVYFISEKIIVGTLVIIEWKTSDTY